MNYITLLTSIGFLLLFTFCSCEEPKEGDVHATTIMETDPFIQNQKLARTINLGNMLEAPQEGEWGLTCEESYFSIIAEAGFTGVRLPVRWSAHAAAEAPYAIDSEFLARIDWAIDNAFENDLCIIVNIHHYTEMMEAPEEHLPRLLAIWDQLAKHFKNRPDNLILELFNEPNDQFTAELWNQYLIQLVDTVRATDPLRTLMVGTAPWGGIDGLDHLTLPPDSNLIVTVHYYNPFQFTHQGTEWSEGAEAWLGNSWGQTNDDYTNLTADFNRVKSWSVERNRPIYVGEFGAYHRADMAYRVLWTQAVVRTCEDRDLSWGYWEFGAGFGAFDISTGEWNGLLTALIPD